MALRLLAHDQGVEGAPPQGGGHGHGAHQRIGAEGQAGHRLGFRLHLLQQ